MVSTAGWTVLLVGRKSYNFNTMKSVISVAQAEEYEKFIVFNHRIKNV